MIKQIEKADPLSCDIDGFASKEQAFGEKTKVLGNKVEDGHEKLKRLQRELDDLLNKILAEK